MATFIQPLLCGSAMTHRFLAAALLAAPRRACASPRPPRRRRQPRRDRTTSFPSRSTPASAGSSIALDRGHAPVTTANFLHYVDTHRFDGENFYRAMHMPANGGG